jgi:ubiquinone/menaquinone biosynthesis C-methylase UbiE
MPFPDASFDVIVCSHVLEHIVEDHKALRELYRVLKPKGIAVLQVPIDSSCPLTDEDRSVTDPIERTRRWGQYDHVRRYGRDYADRLRLAGFFVEICDLNRTLTSEALLRFGLDATEELHIGYR